MFRKLFLLLLVLPLFVAAKSYPEKPLNYVTDEAGVLNSAQQRALNDKLGKFEKNTSNQIFIYITPSLNGEQMSSLCQEIFHSWKIGSTKNNGLLIAVFVNDHKFRIHTGYGLEGALPDLLTKHIQDEEMRPEFKKNDYFRGIDKGVDKLMYYSGREFKIPKPKPKPLIPNWLIIAFSINLLLLAVLIYVLKYQSPAISSLKKQLLGWGIFVIIFPVLGAMILIPLLVVAFGYDLKKIFASKPYDPNADNDDSSGIWFGGGYTNNSSSGWDSGSDSSSSDSDFSGGGGGDSGGGGSDSDW